MFEENWSLIRGEAEKQLVSKFSRFLPDEEENLRETGEVKQMTLFKSGIRNDKNCLKTPITCRLIERFDSARTCSHGQAKFVVMSGNTHIWPHCGPTNCRLRAHLGLRVSNSLGLSVLRVGNETREWKEGKFLIFDDSFEHEIWNKEDTSQLVLVIDMWHTHLSEEQRSKLPFLPI